MPTCHRSAKSPKLRLVIEAGPGASCTARQASRRRSKPAGGGILTLKRPDRFCSVDQGIYGHLTLRNLAVLAEERGDRVEARRLWRMVLDAEALSRWEASQ